MSPRIPAAALAVAVLAACGGGSSSKPPPRAPGDRTIQLSWAPNHETAVNSPGGGYLVSVDGATPVDVPFVTGLLAPTSITTTLHTGDHTFAVWAYAPIDTAGGPGPTVGSGTQITIHVP